MWSHASEKYESLRPERQTGRFKQLQKLLPTHYNPPPGKDEERIKQRKLFYEKYPQKDKKNPTPTVMNSNENINDNSNEPPPLEELPPTLDPIDEVDHQNLEHCEKYLATIPAEDGNENSDTLKSVGEEESNEMASASLAVNASAKITTPPTENYSCESMDVEQTTPRPPRRLRDYAGPKKLDAKSALLEIDETVPKKTDEKCSPEKEKNDVLFDSTVENSLTLDGMLDISDQPAQNSETPCVAKSGSPKRGEEDADTDVFEIENVESIDTEEHTLMQDNEANMPMFAYNQTEAITISDEDDEPLDRVVQSISSLGGVVATVDNHQPVTGRGVREPRTPDQIPTSLKPQLNFTNSPIQ